MMSRDYEGVSPSRKQQLVREFKKIDVNGNGVIDNHEAVEWMVHAEMRDAADGVGDESEELRRIARTAAELFVRDMDTNHDNVIDFAEFVSANRGGIFWHLRHMQQAKLHHDALAQQGTPAPTSRAPTATAGCMDVGTVEAAVPDCTLRPDQSSRGEGVGLDQVQLSRIISKTRF